MTVKYFNVKNGLSTGNISLDATSGNISGTNLSVTGNSNLGAVGNVNITGGASGYFLSTDGNGTLSFVSPSSASNPAPMPIVVETGTTLTIANNYQGLFGYPLTIDGALVVDGILIDVNDNGNGGGTGAATALDANIANVSISGGTSGYYLRTNGAGTLSWAAAGGGSPGGATSQIQYNDSGIFAGTSSFTFTSATSTLNVGNVAVTNNLSTGNITLTGTVVGNIIPSANGTYSLGNSTNKFSNLYLTGNTLTLENSTLSSNTTAFTIATPDAASLQLSSNSNLANSVTANYFIGSGNNLSNIQGANVNGYVGYAAIAYSVAGGNVIGAVGSATYASIANSVNASNIVGTVSSASVSATVTTASQPNITSVGTLTSLSVNGTVTAVNITANTGVFTGNGAGLSSIAAANVTGTVSSATTAGTVTTAAQPNITSVGTLSSLSVTGDVTGGNLITTGTGNVGTLYVGTGGANINGYTKISGNIDVTGNFNVTGNLNYQNVTDLVVGDPLIYLAANAVGDTDDIGIVGNYNNGTYAHTGLARDHTDGTWKFFSGVVAEPTTTIDWANAQYPSVKTGNLFSANITGTGWANITGNLLAGNANLGNAVTANYFIGSGANLTNITGANVTGSVAYATTANSVAGANVSGAVTYATTANSVAGANVSGQVSYAAVANSVAGANVSGAVTYATTANSVAGANVSGAVTYATTANSVAGANVSGTVATATTAGTVTTAAQPNITSTGTLSSLSASGNANVGNLGTGGLITASGAITSGGLVTASQSGFQSATYSSGRNRIWSFGNADAYGISYFQGAGGFATNVDMIGMHFGSATVGGSQFSFVQNGNFYATGDVTAYYSSDIKFKENVQDIKNALDIVVNVGGKTFDWTDEYLKSRQTDNPYFVIKSDFGLIAQDLLKWFPIAVRTRPDGSLAVDYVKLGALGFAATKELSEKVDAQAEIIQKQTTLINDLLSRVEKLEGK